ncbi:MAG: ferritin family protein [candidate division Zixibacteria bacterium]|nr:ferritin family protein [candidate division Zixibacteria bacterium]
MNVFEMCMQMETDGRNFYLEHAGKAELPALKNILLNLADDELKHYNLFKALRDGARAEYKGADMTRILPTTRNVFQEIADIASDFSFPADARAAWVKARDVEKKSEDFYRAEAAKCSDPNQKSILNSISDEEHKNWVALQHVIEFLDRPRSFIEDAEWGGLED